MKRKIFGFGLVLLLFGAGLVFSQTAFDYLRQSIDNVLGFTTIESNAIDYEYFDSGALWGCYLDPNQSLSVSLPLKSGVRYKIYSGADEEQRVAATLKDSRGRTLDGDDDDEGTPIIIYTPNADAIYTFTLTNKSRVDLFIATIVTQYKRDAHFSNDALAEALDNLLSIAEETFEGGDVSFVESQWILFGGNLKDGDETGVYNVNLQRGEYCLIIAGEDSIRTLDTDVIRQSALNVTTGSSIADKESFLNTIMVATFTVSGNNNYYYLKGRNVRSLRGQGFVMGFLFEVE